MKAKIGIFILAGLLASSLASIAQAATNLDSNLAPSATEEMDGAHAAANAPELAADPDPNLSPTTVFAETRLRDADHGAPEIATAPNPNLAASTIY
jgi:hypothetical protein